MQMLQAASALKGMTGGSSGADVSQQQVKTGAPEMSSFTQNTQPMQVASQQKQGSAQDFINAMLARR